MPSLKHHGQMSEAFITALFLSVSGGLQDVYTYLFRGKVFANAQTGNIVLASGARPCGIWSPCAPLRWASSLPSSSASS